MRIAVTVRLSPDDMEQLQPCTLLYRIGSHYNCASRLLEFLVSEKVDILVTDRVPPATTTKEWAQARARTVIVLVALSESDVGCEASCDGCAVIVKFGQGTIPVNAALAVAEGFYTREITSKSAFRNVERAAHGGGKKVLVVGAGIVGLLTSLKLVDEGYSVVVIEKSNDPNREEDWLALGCTHGGENARMFSLTECDNYHDKEYIRGTQLHGYLERTVKSMGWLMKRNKIHTSDEADWISDFANVPMCLANMYNEDIFSINHESHLHWRSLIERHPQLFDGVDYKDKLLRVASTKTYHDKQVKRQRHVKSFIRELDKQQVIVEYPSLVSGCLSGEIVAAIEVVGFTLSIHNFVQNLIGYLMSVGVVFHWRTSAQRLVVEDNVVRGVIANDKLMESDHYFVSTGVYGDDILSGTDSDNKIHGVLGAWISFPNVSPRLERALKISREGHIANSGNIIPVKNKNGEEILLFGSGFGYLGRNVENIDLDQLDALFQSMEEYVAEMFPRAYELAMESGELRASRRYCIRPWTASGLGVFEIKQALSGILIVASGHNTGGFSQSTSVAQASFDAIQGRCHPMHTLYHPKRFDDFWAPEKQRRTFDAGSGSIDVWPAASGRPTKSPTDDVEMIGVS
jgi:glycine/D-amino acid oxidase-like deaminating enzyme